MTKLSYDSDRHVQTHPSSVRGHHPVDEVTRRRPLLRVAVVMPAAPSPVTEVLGSVDGMRLRILTSGVQGLNQVADAGVQRNHSPGDTRAWLWFRR